MTKCVKISEMINMSPEDSPEMQCILSKKIKKLADKYIKRYIFSSCTVKSLKFPNFQTKTGKTFMSYVIHILQKTLSFVMALSKTENSERGVDKGYSN